MSKQINIESYETTKGTKLSGGSGYGGSLTAPSGVSGVTKHSQLEGIASTTEEHSDFARDIHITSANAATLKRFSELDILPSTDLETIPTDFNFYSALKSKLEDEKISQEMESKFIRKDKTDETNFRVDFKDGITAGQYVGGALGDGAIIDKDGNAEMSSLKLRDFLEVPELRFNRIDVVSGELWNSIAFGLIESVDVANQTATLKLEEGELSGLHTNDFCRGIFHNLTGGNSAEAGKDASGFDIMVGFSTSYFTPVEIVDNATFRYELKPGTTTHPCKAMKFAVYGNPVEKNRQSSAYHTRTYTRYLRGVDTWKIEDKHISIQLGDLTNLVINGESLDEGSIYLSNVYFGGHIWYTPEQEEEMKGNDAYSVTLSAYNALFHVAAGPYSQVDITTGADNVATGPDRLIATQFNTTTRIQATRGADVLRYSDTIGKGKYVVTSTGKNCQYMLSDGQVIVSEVTAERADITLTINCEGIATYELVFTIVRVADGMNGIDGKDFEFIYTRTSSETAPALPGTSPDDDHIPAGWTDDPIGPIGSLPYEWMCKREKVNSQWSVFSAPALWSKYSFDGTDGKDGKESEYIYLRSFNSARPATPATSQQDDFVPTGGWTDDPLGVTASYAYEWVCKRTKKDGLWSAFSTPALWSKYGVNGADGTDGQDARYTEERYCRSESQPSISQVSSPPGWALDPPTGTPPLWMSKATFNANGTMYSYWSVPVKLTGEAGGPGAPGASGKEGPFVVSRGEYASSKQYTGNTEHVEVVFIKVGDTRMYYQTKVTAGPFIEEYPGEDTQYWKAYQGQFESIATGFAFIGEANIAGLMFSDTHIESQNKNFVIDGNADDGPRIALGTTYADRHNAPTRMYQDGKIISKRLTAEDGCQIGGFSIENNWLRGVTSGGADDPYSMMHLSHTKASDGSSSQIKFGSNITPRDYERVTARFYNGISNHGVVNDSYDKWTKQYRNIALEAESMFSDYDIAIKAIGGVWHSGLRWDMDRVYPVSGSASGTYNLYEKGRVFVFEDINSNLGFTLPPYDSIERLFGLFQDGTNAVSHGVTFLKIIVNHTSAAAVLVSGVSGTPLLAQDGVVWNEPGSGSHYGSLWLRKGSCMTVAYYNKAWYRMTLNW